MHIFRLGAAGAKAAPHGRNFCVSPGFSYGFASARAECQASTMRSTSAVLFLLAIGVAPAFAAPSAPAVPVQPPPAEFYVVRGTVQGYQARPIANATVVVACSKPTKIKDDGNGATSEWTGSSDADGNFESLHNLRGHCTITVGAKGYRNAVATTDLPAPSKPIVITLQALRIQR